jgi:hypothetical protein
MWQLKDLAHHLLFPRESNNHRAKILHHKSLLILIVGLFLGNLLLQLGERTYPDVLGIAHSINEAELLSLTNEKRKEAGLQPLRLNQELTQAASGKAHDMLTKHYWAHTSPDGVTPWVFIKGSGYEYVYAGENLARGFTSSSDVVNAWMASPGHKANLLSANYEDIGFAIKTGELGGDETVLVVQEFGSRISPDTPKETASAATEASDTSQDGTYILPPAPESQTVVAAATSKPLINTKSMTTSISVALIALVLVVLVIDLWVVEKKKIVRVVAHNADHIIFLSIILAAVIFYSRGIVL